ncbi:ABC transporter permease [Pseudosporangium ferrugineum]|uniref:Putative ABC transport system permease protein n=1 Tax=Pseudosporangium ferrugineum TaxID=439699 RepID=A0A2T0S637_9ACTN|nr:ABC transporter permease [Pseudosporangium ferrugineum]PRY28876.1 putative ABC transport system permease protein [Pseudosporangium ferrugineum]
MLGLSRAGLAERWTLFVGAALSVCLGVALVQSSLLLLISAATMDPPPGLPATERMLFTQNAEAAVAMLGVLLGTAAFLAIFIISSTFGFTVAQRRRDLALLRLVGGSRGQLRRLLLGEAVLLGGLGAALGVPLGLGVMAVQAWLMRRLGFVPDGFRGEWRSWILGVSFGTGIALALAGVLLAARRAARVRPLEALRESGEAARVMTAGRWIAGLIVLGGAVALILVSPHAGPSGGQATSMNVPFCAAAAIAAFGPLLVPAVARLLPVGLGGPLGTLARANLRDGRRRSASVAAPVIVLVGLVLGQAGATTSFTTAGIDEQRRALTADLVVEATGPAAARIAAVPGVAAASTEIELPAEITFDDGDSPESENGGALVVDPAAYAAVHPGSEVVRDLPGRAVAAGPAGEMPSGATVRVKLPRTDLGEVRVTGAVPATLSGGATLLVPAALVPPEELAGAPGRSFVRVAPGASAARVAAALAPLGRVSTTADWLAADAEARNSTNAKIMVVVLGLGALYALIGVVNSVVIGAAARRREFAEARVTGLSRAQIVRTTLAESTAVTGAGIILGLLAASATYAAVLSTTEAVTGTPTLDLPWALGAGVIAVAFLVTSATSIITSWSATRPQPISLLGARE